MRNAFVLGVAVIALSGSALSTAPAGAATAHSLDRHLVPAQTPRLDALAAIADPDAQVLGRELKTVRKLSSSLGPGSHRGSLWLLLSSAVLFLGLFALPGRRRLLGAEVGAERRRPGPHARGARYHIPGAPPLAESAARDAAYVLGGLSASPAVILVDRERGGHPFLDDIDWLLARWRECGLEFRRYDYAYQPLLLRPETGGPALSLDELAGRTAGAPLLIISRMAGAADARGRAPWLGRIAAWPRRVHLDVDPRPLREREYRVSSVLSACADSGLSRFEFAPMGLLAAAHRLGGVPIKAPEKPEIELAPLFEVRDAVVRWARCAALAPDPTWAQL